MNDSFNTLLLLLRSAVGYAPGNFFQKGVDWLEVMDLSDRQGVLAVAMDGVHVLYDKYPDAFAPNDWQAFENIKYEWFCRVLSIESANEGYKDVLKDLLQFYNGAGIVPFLIKGYGLSLEYPNPSHRCYGDIDVFLFGQGASYDEIVKTSMGIQIKQNEDKHSTFVYRHVLVENHATFTNVIESPSRNKIEQYLQEEATRGIEYDLDGTKIIIPTTMFNAVYLPNHMAGHLVYGGLSLRQIVDWAVFLKSHSDVIDWDKVFSLSESAGHLPFLKCLNGIVVRYLGVDLSAVRNDFGPEKLQERIMDEMISNPKYETGVSYGRKVVKYFKSKWKYDLVYNDDFYVSFLKRSWASLRCRHFKNSRNVWSKL